MKIIILGPAPPLRGGISTFNEHLAENLLSFSHQVEIYSFSLQYPRLLFPGKTQYADTPSNSNVSIKEAINSINPLNWIRIGNMIRNIKPDILIPRYWIPFMAPSYGTILRIAKRNHHTKVISIIDNIIPHQKKANIRFLTSFFIASCDGFIVMSKTSEKDLLKFNIEKPKRLVHHPIYNNTLTPLNKKEARAKLGIPQEEKIILFFGFVRPYKGLDLLLEALTDKNIVKQRIHAVIAGEFYENPSPYKKYLKKKSLLDRVFLHDRFIPSKDIPLYFSATDGVVQPYRNATQSGITALAYHFNKPVIVTTAGSLSDVVDHGNTGFVSLPTSKDIAQNILNLYMKPESFFTKHIKSYKSRFSWKTLTTELLSLAEQVKINTPKSYRTSCLSLL